jgi:hypothetical protein
MSGERRVDGGERKGGLAFPHRSPLFTPHSLLANATLAFGMSPARRSENHFPEAAVARDRELIEPNEGDKRYVRRDDEGQFTDEQDDVGRSLAQDRQRHAKKETKSGQGDRGDRKR